MAMWQLRRFSTNSWGNDFDESLGGKKEDMRSISTKTHMPRIAKICAVCLDGRDC